MVIKEEREDKECKEKGRMDDLIDEYLDPALNSNTLLLNLINDILDFV